MALFLFSIHAILLYFGHNSAMSETTENPSSTYEQLPTWGIATHIFHLDVTSSRLFTTLKRLSSFAEPCKSVTRETRRRIIQPYTLLIGMDLRVCPRATFARSRCLTSGIPTGDLFRIISFTIRHEIINTLNDVLYEII